jgi:hypothetical protein
MYIQLEERCTKILTELLYIYTYYIIMCSDAAAAVLIRSDDSMGRDSVLLPLAGNAKDIIIYVYDCSGD